MSKPQKVLWSSSRAGTLSACAHRYAKQYVVGSTGRFAAAEPPERWMSEQGRWRAPKDCMIFLTREVLRQRLQDASLGVVWSESVVRRELTHRLQARLKQQEVQQANLARRLGWERSPTHRVGEARFRELIEEGMERLLGAQKHPLLARLLKGASDIEWFVPDAFQTVDVNGVRIYAAPDIAIRDGRRWRLVRISGDVRWVRPSALRVVELNTLLLWAKAVDGMPNAANRYRVSRLGWKHGRWHIWSIRGNTLFRNESERLVSKDAQAMAEIRTQMGPANDIQKLPYTEQAWRCKSCPYRWTCDGAKTPERARLAQVYHEREMAGSES